MDWRWSHHLAWRDDRIKYGYRRRKRGYPFHTGELLGGGQTVPGNQAP